MTDQRRAYAPPLKSDTLRSYLHRHCKQTATPIEQVLQQLESLLFEGATLYDALVDAMWVLGMWDETDDKIPSLKKLRIRCEVDTTVIDRIPSVIVRCTRCAHETESYGRSIRSVRRCLLMLREECPNDEANYYLVEENDEYGDDAYEE